ELEVLRLDRIQDLARDASPEECRHNDIRVGNDAHRPYFVLRARRSTRAASISACISSSVIGGSLAASISSSALKSSPAACLRRASRKSLSTAAASSRPAARICFASSSGNFTVSSVMLPLYVHWHERSPAAFSSLKIIVVRP